jgi:hypothetical protein
VSAAIRAFRQFVDAGLFAHSPWKDLRQEIYLGDELFIGNAQIRMLEARRHDTEIPKHQRSNAPKPLAAVFGSSHDASSAILTAYHSGHFTMRQIADYLGVHYSTISRLLARIEMSDCKT